jgi:hypothetical protein
MKVYTVFTEHRVGERGRDASPVGGKFLRPAAACRKNYQHNLDCHTHFAASWLREGHKE